MQSITDSTRSLWLTRPCQKNIFIEVLF